jgi:cysteine desulfurase family protein
MSQRGRVYLDNAATSWPKPEAVYAAVDSYLRKCGAPAGRSAYAEANQATHSVNAARAGAARLLGAEDPKRIVFTFNGTDALNLAIHGLLTAGDHVVTTVVDHNSVLRPLRELERTGAIAVSRISCDGWGVVDPDDVRRAMGARTRLVAIDHASNVTGALQPVADVARIAHERGALVLVDAAQTVGQIAVNVADLGIDLLAAPGHKGLLGPTGTGVLYIRSGLESQVRSIRQGGTGTQSEEDRQPETMPYKYESGSINVAGIVGLEAGINFLRMRGLDAVREHHRRLTQRMLDGFAEIAGVRLYGPRSADQRVGVVSITLDGYDPQEAAATLDAAYRIQVRSGVHCAPLMHRALGTLDSGGTVRFSLGVFTTEADVDAAVAAVAELAAEAVPSEPLPSTR